MKTKLSILALAVFSLSAHAAPKNCDNDVQKQLDDLEAGLHKLHFDVQSKYADSWGLEDRANIAKLQEEKLDKSVFTADQQRQDAAAASVRADQVKRDAGQDEHINAVQNAAQAANEAAGNLSAAVQETNAQLAVTDQRSQHTAVRADKLEESQRAQDRQMESDRQQRVNADKALGQQITTSSAYAQSRIDAANANIEANRNALVSSNKRIAANTAQLANHEQRLNDMQQQSNRQFASLGQRIDKVQDRANAGTATALAAAGIPQVTGEQRFSLGAAVGGYESENALAVGFSSRVSQNVVVKASVATDTQHGVGYNVGASVGW